MEQLQKKEKSLNICIYIRVRNAEQLSIKEQSRSIEEGIKEINKAEFGKGGK